MSVTSKKWHKTPKFISTIFKRKKTRPVSPASRELNEIEETLAGTEAGGLQTLDSVTDASPESDGLVIDTDECCQQDVTECLDEPWTETGQSVVFGSFDGEMQWNQIDEDLQIKEEQSSDGSDDVEYVDAEDDFGQFTELSQRNTTSSATRSQEDHEESTTSRCASGRRIMEQDHRRSLRNCLSNTLNQICMGPAVVMAVAMTMIILVTGILYGTLKVCTWFEKMFRWQRKQLAPPSNRKAHVSGASGIQLSAIIVNTRTIMMLLLLPFGVIKALLTSLQPLTSTQIFTQRNKT